MRESREETVEDRKLRSQDRMSRFSWGMSSVLWVGLLVLAFGRLPTEAAALTRTGLLVGLTGWSVAEALRHFQHGLLPGSMRWTRAAIGAGFGAMTLGLALRHLGPIAVATPDGVFATGVALLPVALLLDLRERRERSRAETLARVGIIVGAVGTALMGAGLLGETRLPWSVWWPLFLAAAVLVGVAGAIYLRVRSAGASNHRSDRRVG